MDEARLKEKLAAIEALFEGATTEGERQAAANARERVKARLAVLARESPPVEWKFTMNDMWSRRLLVALLRRYGLDPYRYSGQRYTTVMVMVPKKFVDEVLWPQFLELDKTLRAYLEEVTERVIGQVVHKDASEAAEVADPNQLGPGRK